MVYVIRTLEKKYAILFILIPATGGPVSVPANNAAIENVHTTTHPAAVHFTKLPCHTLLYI